MQTLKMNFAGSESMSPAPGNRVVHRSGTRVSQRPVWRAKWYACASGEPRASRYNTSLVHPFDFS